MVVLDSLAATAAAPWIGRVAAPVVGMLHQPPGGMDANSFARSFRAPFDRHAYRTCRVLIVASEWLAEQLAAAGVAARQAARRCARQGSRRANRGRDDIHPMERAQLRDGRLMAALTVANWLPLKGIIELLDAVAGLADEVVTLHLVGDTATPGAYARRIRERLEQPDLRDRVVVHGLIPPADVARMYRAVDAFVLPSFVETYGTVWGEAMAAGLPVIGWRAGNLPFLADDGKDGMLVPVGDVAALGDAIELLARDPDLRALIGQAAAASSSGTPDVGRDGRPLLRDHRSCPIWADTGRFASRLTPVTSQCRGDSRRRTARLSANPRPADRRTPTHRPTRRPSRAGRRALAARASSSRTCVQTCSATVSTVVACPSNAGKRAEVGGIELGQARGQRRPEGVDVDQHRVLVELLASRHDLSPVVVAVLVAGGGVLGLELMEGVKRPGDADFKHSQAPPAGTRRGTAREARTRRPRRRTRIGA